MSSHVPGINGVADLAAAAALLLIALTPAVASGAGFVQGEGLPSCPGGHVESPETDRVGVSRDGTTAAWGECVYTRPGASWEIQSELPTRPPWGMSYDGGTLLTYRDGVFTREGGTWSQQTATDFEAISGDGTTAVNISEPQGVASKKAVPRTFHVHVYTRSGEVWSLQAEFTQTILGGGGFGAHAEPVALSGDGDTLIIGAPFLNRSKGAAYVYARSGESWELQATLTPSGEKGGADFAQQVALSEDGSTALIGGKFNRGAHGAAWVFTRSGGMWTQQTELNSGGVKKETFFGQSVALSADGDTALVGAGGEPPGRKQEPGAAFVFERSGGSWSATQTLRPNGEEVIHDGFGSQVALSGDGQTAFVREGSRYFTYTFPTGVTVWTR